jgi:uncharacterized repeat protein (TIGR03837 family)
VRTPARWEIFCRVIDNYGDIGVCWRLARQLVAEHGVAVRLWLDALPVLAPMVDGLDLEAAVQTLDGVELRAWSDDLALDAEGLAGWPEVVIEGFGCGLPERHLDRLSARATPPLWIVLEYLSAEPWVAEHHGLASPPPRHRLGRFFFFPGFDEGTGGLLRERELPLGHEVPDDLAGSCVWQGRGLAPPAPDTFTVSVFAYPDAPIQGLFEALREPDSRPTGRRASRVAVAPGALAESLGNLPGTPSAIGLEVLRLPFVRQTAFDELLRVCDLNIVRGEDSFVRAQWAARPFVWHIYPQPDDAHRIKLDAFLDRYCRGMSGGLAQAIRDLWHAFNARPAGSLAVWCAVLPYWTDWEEHARRWASQLARSPDLCSRLVRFCAERL